MAPAAPLVYHQSAERADMTQSSSAKTTRISGPVTGSSCEDAARCGLPLSVLCVHRRGRKDATSGLQADSPLHEDK